MINAEGWHRYSIWEHSARVKELYARRCRLEEPEMTCAVQAVELLEPRVRPGDVLLDAGCGSGYFYHSLRERNIPIEYIGIDASASLIEIGRKYLPAFGLAPKNLQVMRIEDLDGQVDHVLCMNVLTNLDNYHRPLERLLKCTRKTLVLRESCAEHAEYKYVRDEYLDEGCDLKVYVNAYPMAEWTAFIESYGFEVQQIEDHRSKGRPESVIGYPHYWSFFLAERRASH